MINQKWQNTVLCKEEEEEEENNLIKTSLQFIYTGFTIIYSITYIIDEIQRIVTWNYFSLMEIPEENNLIVVKFPSICNHFVLFQINCSWLRKTIIIVHYLII